MSAFAVVIPTNRPERFAQWAAAWAPLIAEHDVRVFVCEDLDEPGVFVDPAWGEVLARPTWPWWVPRGTDMCRSWGMVQAFRSGADYIVSLDDDVLPDGDLFAEYEAVFERGAVCSPYFDVGALTSFDGQMRGFPYGDRERRPVGLQVGGWSGVPDFDARTQLELAARSGGYTGGYTFERVVVPVPSGAAVTVCAMNMAWRREYTPVMWQLPMLEGRYNRHGDIWAGLFAKQVLDAADVAVVVNGRAQVVHQRASDPVANLEREAPGIPLNEGLWWNIPGSGSDLFGVYRGVTGLAGFYFDRHDREYAEHFRACREAWLAEFAEVRV